MNNSAAAIHLANASGATTRFHNNTVHNTAPEVIRQDKAGGANRFENNIFHTTHSGASMFEDSGTTYDHNLYSGASPDVPTGEDNEVVAADPKFVNPTASSATPTGATRPYLDAGLNWRIRPDSPAVRAGLAIADNGGADYDGTALPPAPDLGALQHVIVGDTFDALPTGALASGTNGWTVVSTGNKVEVTGTPGSTDRSVKLTRGQDTGGLPGTNLTRTFPEPLTGTVTFEADVMRNDNTTKGDYFGLPYLYNSANEQVISVGFFERKIVAYSGTTRRDIMPYTQGTWYHVKLVVDTTRQRFDLFIDDERVLTDAPFRTQAPGIARMAFYANGGNFGSAHVNNVKVH
ncbi:hypothetical protein ACWGB8_29925 [Kitasatospora sp. NPDC054939]